MSWFPPPDEYKPTPFEIWIGSSLKNAFTKALAAAGIYTVASMIEPLKQAIEADNAAGVRGILEKCPKAIHAELDVLTREPLRFALEQEKYAAAFAMLAAAPAALGDRDYFGRTALVDMAAKFTGDDAKSMRILQALLDRGADINDADKEGKTALHQAAWRTTPAVAEFLLAKGAAVDARDEGGQTPLMIAADYGHIDTMALLLDHGADMNALSPRGLNAATGAILFGRFDSALWLMRRGATVNFAAPGIDETLARAKPEGNAEILALLAQQRKAWEDGRRDAAIEDAVRGIEDGLDKPLQVHALRLKTGLGRFRRPRRGDACP